MVLGSQTGGSAEDEMSQQLGIFPIFAIGAIPAITAASVGGAGVAAGGAGAASILGGVVPLLGSVLGFGTKFWAQSEVQEAQEKALAQARKQREIQERTARLQRLQAQKAAMEQQLIEMQALEIARAQARRQSTTLALYAVGGVAAAVGAIFVIQGLRGRAKK